MANKYLSSRKKRGIQIIRGDEFDRAFFNFQKTGKEIVAFLNKKMESAQKMDNGTYRLINHWTQLGILDDDRDSNQKWRKFSIVDRIWFLIVLELRKFGVANEKILASKKHFEEMTKDYPLCEFFLGQIGLSKHPVYFVFFGDGFCEIATDQQIKASQLLSDLNENFILINLNNFLAGMLGDESISKAMYKKNFVPTKEEWELLQILSEKECKKIEIVLKNGTIEQINLTKAVTKPSEKRLIDVIKESLYQSIRIEVQDGKQVYIEKTEKRNVKAPKKSEHLQAA